MMYCKKCGKEIGSKTTCPYCLTSVQSIEHCRVSDSRRLVGFLLGLFLSFLGFIIGAHIYAYGSAEERTTFYSGWWMSFVIQIVVGVILGFAFLQ
ncbi:MAG: hypothetical protein J6C93_05775 [Clostridia bacterium]|nr:hypothetical protein [Clostridia bacterium]